MRVVDDAVQAGVEPVRGVAGAEQVRRLGERAFGARSPDGHVDAVGALAQVSGGRAVGVRVACQTLPSGANDQAGSPPPWRRRAGSDAGRGERPVGRRS